MTRANQQVVLISRPEGAASLANCQLRDSTILAPAAGEVLVRTVYLSIDPWLRTVMNDAVVLPLDTVVPGDVVGRVVESRHPLFRAGDIVQGLLGWQHYVIAPWYLLRKIDPSDPFGVHVYFDNVGGRVSDAVLPVMNTKARVVVCGQIASYDRRVAASRLPWLGVVLEKRIRIEGFLVTDYGDH